MEIESHMINGILEEDMEIQGGDAFHQMKMRIISKDLIGDAL